jgi:CheY-like chemotaxis protein
MRRVLYVDDNADNVYLMEQIVTQRPHIELISAGSAADGIQAARSVAPDLILLDQRLPDGLGSEVLVELKQAESTASVPVVLFSADDQIAKPAITEWGADGFLAKPFDIAELLGLLDAYCPQTG